MGEKIKRNINKMERAWVWVVGVVVLLAAAAQAKPPNIIVFLADDLGIGDVGCYGNTTINTPNIDKCVALLVTLAVDNHTCVILILLTPIVSTGLVGQEHRMPVILHLASLASLPVHEVTLASALQAANYTTSIIGKWHLGMHCGWLGRSCPGPLSHGFESFFGIPGLLMTWVVTMLSLLVAVKKKTVRMSLVVAGALLTNLLLALVSPWLHQRLNSMVMRDDKVVEAPMELDGFSQRLAQESRQFIASHANDDRPFFLFHSFAHVHTPMFSAPQRAGVSKHGRYGDNVEELDESMGVVLQALKEYGLEDNTLIYFTSDQGGHLEAVDSDGQRIGGHNGRFKGGKAQGGSEGAIRVPGIFKWPGHLPKGVTLDTPTSLMDLLPTVLSLAGLPSLSKIVPEAAQTELDGEDISELLVTGKGRKGPRFFIHHCSQAINALRLVTGSHVYKMYLAKHKWHPGSTQCGWGYNTACKCYGEFVDDMSHQPELWDLNTDPYEDGKPIDPHTVERVGLILTLHLSYGVKVIQGSGGENARVSEAMARESRLPTLTTEHRIQDHVAALAPALLTPPHMLSRIYTNDRRVKTLRRELEGWREDNMVYRTINADITLCAGYYSDTLRLFGATVVVIVLIPGMRPHGILQKYFSAALKTIAGLLKSSVSAVQGGGGGGGSANGDASKKKE
ncbi:Steryl-sulfatase-like 1 [Homarus americanus]|uniref:Steryl-sulfatase-like 1 n=1 Tax=Homarus americanus TaxID=6706 RepID=A0A8J5MWC7_HOMAM|nr:Steryl-sulfatase-like 1 [Homarus americanus]